MMDYAALNAWVESHRDTPFRIGEHDCFTFANGAARAFTGHGFADDWAGRYTDKRGRVLGRRALRSRFGFDSLADAFDARLTRASLPAPRGCIVATEHAERTGPLLALGVSLGAFFAVPGKTGLTFLPHDAAAFAWDVT